MTHEPILRWLLSPLLVALATWCAVVPPGLRAQCALQWQAGDPMVMCRGTVFSMVLWDPDDTGPLTTELVAAGHAGILLSNAARVSTFDGTRWRTLDGLPGTTVRSAVVWNGQLVVASGMGVYVWTGSTWQTLGVGSGVVSMVVWNGSLYVGGTFTTIGGVGANRVARWDGSAWSALGAGIGTGNVSALAVFQNVLYVGGQFTSAGGVAAGNLAVWNGSAWVTTASANGAVTRLAPRIGMTLVDSYLFAGGSFTTIGGTAANRVARFTPTTNAWTALGAGLPGTGCNALFVRATGLSSFELTAINEHTVPAQMYRWNAAGSTWVAMGAPPGGASSTEAMCIGVWAGAYVLGRFALSGDAVHRLVGTTWEPLRGAGIAGRVLAVLADGSETILGGDFATISGTVTNRIARGTPGNWSPLGSGMDGAVTALAKMPNGDLVAGGYFTTAGGQVANGIARWNGVVWSPLGTGVGPGGWVTALAVLQNGDLVAAGQFSQAGGLLVANIARWNGSAWTGLGLGLGGIVRSLLACANGDLIAGGEFPSPGPHIARWNGSVWSPMGTGSSSLVPALVELPGGDVVASGTFAGVNSLVARWNGTSWSAVEVGSPATGVFPYSLQVLPDGDLVAGGSLPSTILGDTVHRLDGGVWQPLGVRAQPVAALAVGADGTLRVGGDFDGQGSGGAARFAVLATPCPASATSAAPGCASSGGSNTLVATTLPWANGPFRTRATGVPANSLVLVLTSVTPVVPPVSLAALFGQGVPGCDLHVAPDVLQLAVAAGGIAQSELFLPNVPPITGVTFYHQMIPIEFDPSTGAWLAITATNALRLTAGIF